MNKLFDFHLNELADRLAAEDYAVIDNFLTSPEVDAILALASFKNGLTQFKQAGIGQNQQKQINEAIRGDLIHWIDPEEAEPALLVYLKKLNGLISFVNENLFLSLKDSEVHQTIYPVGSFYKRHLDQFKKDDRRKLSVICYLNKNWKESDGGQLRMYLEDGYKDIVPYAGRLVCFRSDRLEHEVLPASRERLSLTGWLVDRIM